jgi:hypothetical protein
MREINIRNGQAWIKVTIDGTTVCLESNLTTNLDTSDEDDEDEYAEAIAAIDGLESLVLAHASAGVNIEDPLYQQGIWTALEAIGNNL